MRSRGGLSPVNKDVIEIVVLNNGHWDINQQIIDIVRNFVFSNHFVSHFPERKTLFPRTLIPDMTSRKYHEQRNG